MRWLTVEEISELLEHELTDAVEVKDLGSLKRFVRLLAENAVGTSRYEKDQQGTREDIRSLITEIHYLFAAKTKRTVFFQVTVLFPTSVIRFFLTVWSSFSSRKRERTAPYPLVFPSTANHE